MHTVNRRAASGKATPVVRSVNTENHNNIEGEYQGETALFAAMRRALEQSLRRLVFQRDGGLCGNGAHDADRPFGTPEFAAAVATAASVAKGTRL